MTNSNTPIGPLSGVRVLDLTRILAGPTSTQLLGDYGADIVKVEKPGRGDDTRAWGPPYLQDSNGNATSESAYYMAANRNKRSIALDISTDEGVATIRKLAAKCDIVVENFKTGGLAKYGLGYESLKAINPSLIYCSITGFGQTGPNAKLAGYDLMAQGYGGIMSLTGAPDGEPMKVGIGIADVMCGMYACTAILAALRHRDQTGQGQHIDVALVDTQIAWLINEGVNYLTSGEVPQRRGNEHPNIVPYGIFEVGDGHLIIAVGNDAQFTNFCAAIGHPELADDTRYKVNIDRIANRNTLIAALVPIIRQIDKQTLLASMNAAGVTCGPIHTIDEVFASDQVAAREMKITIPHLMSGSGTVDLIGNPVKFSETPVTYRKAPPACGADTDEILNDWLNGD
ncbi:MAG: CaiB/BaiF CoA-transferase family protein [Paracoccaceae bacterium]